MLKTNNTIHWLSVAENEGCLGILSEQPLGDPMDPGTKYLEAWPLRGSEGHPLGCGECHICLQGLHKQGVRKKGQDPYQGLLEHMLSQMRNINQLFVKIDKDASGTIDAIELRFALRDMDFPVTQREFDALWERLDVHKTGEIEYKELIQAVRDYGSRLEARKQKQKKLKARQAREEEQTRLSGSQRNAERQSKDPVGEAMANGVEELAEAIHPYGEPTVQNLLKALRGTKYEEFALWLAIHISRYITVGQGWEANIAADQLRLAVETYSYTTRLDPNGSTMQSMLSPKGTIQELCQPCSPVVMEVISGEPAEAVAGERGGRGSEAPPASPLRDRLSTLANLNMPDIPDEIDISGLVNSLPLSHTRAPCLLTCMLLTSTVCSIR